ncbi:hypothetical protein, partial [Escherichia coli]|uniref:hypothetical protein n=1 Tax=Escherichia coli TaxID=562 RepID=UPI002541968A
LFEVLFIRFFIFVCSARPSVIMDQRAKDNKADQQNPNNPKGGGYGSRPAGYTGDKANLDNRSQQMNPNNEKYGSKK